MNVFQMTFLILVVGTLNIVCFFIGAKLGQTVAKDKDIEVPKISGPIKKIKEHQRNKENEKAQEKLGALLRNIEKYDGTGNGQEDIPKG